jgi:hypothetical protein
MNKPTMDPITLTDSEKILNLLAHIALKGKGFVTDCLLDDVIDAGFTAPTHFSAHGEDADAFYSGHSHAWAVYHVREWKRVMMVYGGTNKERRIQITETP